MPSPTPKDSPKDQPAVTTGITTGTTTVAPPPPTAPIVPQVITPTAALSKTVNPAVELAQSKTVPSIMADQLTQDDWDAMSMEERLRAAVFFHSEQAETLRGVGIKFPRLQYPTSGTRVWQIDQLEGDPKFIAKLAGTIIFKQNIRALWLREDGELATEVTNSPPTCSSPDGKRPETIGPGRQAESCGECPRAQFGTGKDGSGQACKARLNLFLLLDKEVCYGEANTTKFPILDDIPTVLSLPPTQLGPFGQFIVEIRKKSKSGSLLSNTTVFGLKEDRNRTGIAYTALDIQIGRPLSYKQMEQAAKLRDQFEQAFKERGFVVDDVPETAASEVPF